jgi:hypothetical protein
MEKEGGNQDRNSSQTPLAKHELIGNPSKSLSGISSEEPVSIAGEPLCR